MKIKNILFLICVVVFIFFYFSCISFAVSVSDIPRHKINELPIDLDLQINQECSGHSYFLQADANEKGHFVLFSHKDTLDKINNDIFKRKYIDVYNSDCEFCFELVFVTTMEPALRLVGNTVYLIFYDNMITVDIETKEINYYSIPGSELWEYTNSEIIQDEEFTVGAWTYECKRDMQFAFTKLIRSNNAYTDVLIEMPGSQNKAYYGVFFAIGAGIVLFIIKKKKLHE